MTDDVIAPDPDEQGLSLYAVCFFDSRTDTIVPQMFSFRLYMPYTFANKGTQYYAHAPTH